MANQQLVQLVNKEKDTKSAIIFSVFYLCGNAFTKGKVNAGYEVENM